MPIVPVSTWCLPDNLVDCLPGGLLHDDEGGTAPRSLSVRPDDTWKVADIKAWLDANGVDYPSSALKAELLSLASGPTA